MTFHPRSVTAVVLTGLLIASLNYFRGIRLLFRLINGWQFYVQCLSTVDDVVLKYKINFVENKKYYLRQDTTN